MGDDGGGQVPFMTNPFAAGRRALTRWVCAVEGAIDDADSVWDDLRDEDVDILFARRTGAGTLCS